MKNNRETSTQANVATTSKIEVINKLRKKSSDYLRAQEKIKCLQQELEEARQERCDLFDEMASDLCGYNDNLLETKYEAESLPETFIAGNHIFEFIRDVDEISLHLTPAPVELSLIERKSRDKKLPAAEENDNDNDNDQS